MIGGYMIFLTNGQWLNTPRRHRQGCKWKDCGIGVKRGRRNNSRQTRILKKAQPLMTGIRCPQTSPFPSGTKESSCRLHQKIQASTLSSGFLLKVHAH
jgi:hypothetical protein